MFIKLGMIILFFAVTLLVGVLSSRKAKGVDGFVLGGRSVGPWLTAFSFGTSYFSAVIFIGYAGRFGWDFGLASTWIGLGNAFLGSLLAWVILGRRTRIMTQHFNSATMSQFFGQRFQSKSLKVGSSIIIFLFLIPYTASLYNGLSSLFNNVFAIPYWVVVIVMAVLTGVYVIFGGYMATAINDFIQGIIMLVGIVAVIAAVLNSQGGLMEALSGLGQITDPAVSETPGIFNSFFGLFGIGPLKMIGTPGAVVLGMVYNFIPFMILQIHSSLAKMDKSLIEAANDLGANPVQSFLKVTLPLSLPGVLSGITLVFLPAVSSFFIPKLLGGGQYVLVGNVIETQFLTSGDWNFGAAISLIMAIIIMISMWLTRKVDTDPAANGKGA